LHLLIMLLRLPFILLHLLIIQLHLPRFTCSYAAKLHVFTLRIKQRKK